MSKLPKAPLVEVIFELRWVLPSAQIQDAQYIAGDLYHLIKDNYPYREALQQLPPGLVIQAPTHRFRHERNGYPLVQVGPGLLTVNITDEKYFWNDFLADITSVLRHFQTVYKFDEEQVLTAHLRYIDFLAFDFDKQDVFKYLEEKLHLKVDFGFLNYEKAKVDNTVLAVGLKIPEGELHISISNGKNSKGNSGIAINTLITNKLDSSTKDIVEWLGKAHEITRSVFKEMTKGELQKQFTKLQ